MNLPHSTRRAGTTAFDPTPLGSHEMPSAVQAGDRPRPRRWRGSSSARGAATPDTIRCMGEAHTTAVVQRYLQKLAVDAEGEAVVRELLERSIGRLHFLCNGLLARSYPRLMRPPLNLQSEEMLSSVVERLMKAMREIRPQTTRQFFALATRHMRWELNDVARRFDEQSRAVELHDDAVASPTSSHSVATPNVIRMLAAIDSMPEEEREVFDLVRIQGLSPAEAAEVLGVTVRTVQRRVNRSFVLLADKLADLNPAEQPPGST